MRIHRFHPHRRCVCSSRGPHCFSSRRGSRPAPLGLPSRAHGRTTCRANRRSRESWLSASARTSTQRCPFERVLASKLKSESTRRLRQLRRRGAEEPAHARKHRSRRRGEEGRRSARNQSSSPSNGRSRTAGPTTTRGGAYYKATDSYFGPYGAPVVYADFSTTPSIMTVQGEAHVTSKLYETQGATVVYTVDTKVQKVTSSDAGIAPSRRRSVNGCAATD